MFLLFVKLILYVFFDFPSFLPKILNDKSLDKIILFSNKNFFVQDTITKIEIELKKRKNKQTKNVKILIFSPKSFPQLHRTTTNKAFIRLFVKKCGFNGFFH